MKRILVTILHIRSALIMRDIFDIKQFFKSKAENHKVEVNLYSVKSNGKLPIIVVRRDSIGVIVTRKECIPTLKTKHLQ